MSELSLQAVADISRQLHVCLAKAINTAMIQSAGEDWFEEFRKNDRNQTKPVLESEHTSVNRMDLQACLKFLRFRKIQSNAVFAHYGYDFSAKTEDTEKAERMLNQLLDNIIHNVRNHLVAHVNADMVASGGDDSLRYSVYGPKEAANDMLRLAEFFRSITDEDGVSIYAKMQQLAQPTEAYSVAETLKKENIKLSVGAFVELCNKNNMEVVTGKNGEMYFHSSNYEGDIAKLKLYISNNFKQLLSYSISEVIEKEQLDTSVGSFVEACQKNQIAISTNSGGLLVFSTANYQGDLARIKLSLGASKPKHNKLVLFGFLFALAVIAVLIAVIIGLSGKETPADPSAVESPGVGIPMPTSEPEQTTVPVTEEPTTQEPTTEEPTTEPPTTEPALEDYNIYGKETYGTLTFTVDQKHDNNIVLQLTNGELRYKFGWVVDKTVFYVETVSGQRYAATNCNYNGSESIIPYGVGNIYLFYNEIDEPIKTLICTHVKTLDERGLPTNDATVLIDIAYSLD